MSAKLREQSWHERTRMQRLASVLFPGLADEDTRRQMAELARGEGKRPPATQPLLADHTRGCQSPLGGRAKP
jgi:hypothetical protein